MARPVPGSVPEQKNDDCFDETISKTRKVSFASKDGHGVKLSSVTDSRRPSVLFDVSEENVFIEDETDSIVFPKDISNDDRLNHNNMNFGNGHDKKPDYRSNSRTKMDKKLRQKSCDF